MVTSSRVSNSTEALEYIVECTLATIGYLAYKNNISINEFNRQVSISQQGVDWLIQFNANITSLRIKEVIALGNVEMWVD